LKLVFGKPWTKLNEGKWQKEKEKNKILQKVYGLQWGNYKGKNWEDEDERKKLLQEFSDDFYNSSPIPVHLIYKACKIQEGKKGATLKDIIGDKLSFGETTANAMEGKRRWDEKKKKKARKAP